MSLTVEERQAELEEPIELIEAEVANLQQQIDEAPGKLSEMLFKRLCSKVDWANERLRRAQQRTDVDRPVHCWCRGTGGVGRVTVYEDEETHFLIQDYCRCEAGKARQSVDVDVRVAERGRRHAARLALWLDNLPPSFRAFRSHELATYPVNTEPQRQVLEQLRKFTGEDDGSDLRPWLYLHGPVGVGKTGLSVAVAKALMRDSGDSAVMIDVAGLLSRIRRTYSKGADETGGDVMEEMQDARILILDDFGAERITDWVHEQLFSLINHRYGDYDPDDYDPNLTIITSNYDLAGLAEHIGGVAGERIAWRIGERSLVVSLEECQNLRVPRVARELKPAESTDRADKTNVRDFKKSRPA